MPTPQKRPIYGKVKYKKMDAVSKISLHAEKRDANGHTIVGATFVYRNTVVPCAVRLWTSKIIVKNQRKIIRTNNEIQNTHRTSRRLPQHVRLLSSGKAIVLFYLGDGL
jgi:hypothetical protein